MLIQGQYTTAVCYAKIIEEEAIEQIRAMCSMPFTEGCQVRVMPDVHAGTGCTIGTTMTIRGKAVPNVVGVDIGCGMYTLRLNKRDIDFAKVDEAAHAVPSGKNVWDSPREDFDLTELHCYRHLHDTDRLSCSLGTLGGGNHFIEIDRDSGGDCWLVIHSGSRNLGLQVANLYQKAAVAYHTGNAAQMKQERDALIEEYKSSGRAGELEAALAELMTEQQTESLAKREQIKPELCWLEGEELEHYLHDVKICQRFARRSRELMAEELLRHTGMQAMEAFHTVHNYIDTDEMILRKGAIAAHKGERVLIPINMRDGSVLAVGRGNPEWNYSAPHGAGRILSRTSAKNQLQMSDFVESMKGVYTTSVCENTLDESPMAYKSLADIIDVIRDSVDIIDVMKPIYNFKASE